MTVHLIAASVITGPLLLLAGWCLWTDPTYRAMRTAWRNRRSLRRAVERHPAKPFDWRDHPDTAWLRQPTHVHRTKAKVS